MVSVQCSRQTVRRILKAGKDFVWCGGVCILAHAICFIFVQLSTFQFVFILQPFCPVTLQCSVGKITQSSNPKILNKLEIFDIGLTTNSQIQSSIESKTAKIWMSTLIRVFEWVHKLLSLCQRAGGQRSTVGLNFNGFWLRRMYVHNLGL